MFANVAFQAKTLWACILFHHSRFYDDLKHLSAFAIEPDLNFTAMNFAKIFALDYFWLTSAPFS